MSTLDLPLAVTFTGYLSDVPICMAFSPSSNRLAVCCLRGPVCVLNTTGTLFVQTLCPPGGHFASHVRWELDDELWIAFSNGHVVRLHVPAIGDMQISDWINYRFTSVSCITTISPLHRAGHIALAFSDRVEIWRHRGVGDWILVSATIAEDDFAENVWSIVLDTVAVHYRRRGLCYWNYSNPTETTAEICAHEWVSPDYRVAFNKKEELFVTFDSGYFHVYFLDKFDTEGLYRARIRRHAVYKSDGITQSPMHSMSFVSVGASPYLALGFARKLSFCTIHTPHSEGSMVIHLEKELPQSDLPPAVSFTSGTLNTPGMELLSSKQITRTLEYSTLLRSAFRWRKLRARLAFAGRSLAAASILAALAALGLQSHDAKLIMQQLVWRNSSAEHL